MNLYFTGPRRPVFCLVWFWLIALCSGFAMAKNSQKLDSIPLTINQTSLQAELAITDSERALGLMYRTELAPNSGMLFVFDQTTTGCFWMKNTPLPLSIAFITDQGTISNIEQMQPFSTAARCPIVPIKYALEMEQGWFNKNNIHAGDQVKLLP